MKNILLAVLTLLTLIGCGQKTEAELERENERALARIEANKAIRIAEAQNREIEIEVNNPIRQIMPISPGAYVDYRGNTEYGYWDADDEWEWHNPNGIRANESRSYIDYQISTGRLPRTYLSQPITKDKWTKARGGKPWRKRTIVVDDYTSISGRTLSREAYHRSVEQKTNKWKKTQLRSVSSYAKKTPKTAAELKHDAYLAEKAKLHAQKDKRIAAIVKAKAEKAKKAKALREKKLKELRLKERERLRKERLKQQQKARNK